MADDTVEAARQALDEALFDCVLPSVTRLVDALIDAVRAEQQARIASLEESLHYCNGVADLAMRDRDENAAALAKAEAEQAELREALRVIHATVRGDEKSECWTIRKFLDDREVFNGDIGGSDRLIESACAFVLKSR